RQDADHPRPHRGGKVPRLRDHRPAQRHQADWPPPTRERPDRATGAEGRLARGKPAKRPALNNSSDHAIVATFGSVYRGIVQYYLLAGDVFRLHRLRWVMETSMLKTLAAKHRSSVPKIAAKHKVKIDTPLGPRTAFEVRIERPGRKPLVAQFGGLPLHTQ